MSEFCLMSHQQLKSTEDKAMAQISNDRLEEQEI